MTTMEKRQKPYGELYPLLIALAMPIIIQNLISNSLVMVDTVMISKLGDAAVAAVGIGGRLQFIFVLVIYGFYSGAGIFIAQYNGARRYDKIRMPMALQLSIGFLGAMLFSMIAIFWGEQYVRIFSKDPEVIELGAIYLRYLAIGFVPGAIGYAFVVALRSVKDPKFPMFTSIVAISVNTLLNYALIFGHFGLPKLGVKGAAIATTCARLIEFMMMIYTVYFGSRGLLKVHFADISKIERAFFKKYVQTSWPIIANEAIWGLGTVMYSLAYSKLGTAPFAATQRAQIINDIMLVASFGMASSVGTILGNKLGEGDRETAIRYSRKIMQLSVVTGLLTGGVLFLISPLVPKIFGVSGAQARSIVSILRVRAVANCFITFNWTNVTGILRSGGDTVFALLIDVLPMWLIGIPLAMIGATVLGWRIEMVVMATFADEMVKFVIGVPRALQNKWANVLVEGRKG
ncbi:MAG: MATE family efflux transporter [Peptostreptococcaceae bacterium]|nr:MATE family efflux transporter [Peptostreptococcaceae bacterium]